MNKRIQKHLRELCLFTAIAAVMPIAAHAQERRSGSTEPKEERDDTIVVTGTLLRGVAPGGSQAIGVDEKKITEAGATNVSQVLATVPQVGLFNNQGIGTYVQAGTRMTINRPDIRNLAVNNITSATSATLTLLDGHRLPGMGLLQNGPDSDVLPIGALERVEVVPDGGSSIYGSDAVGGVVNFITRKRFDGVELNSHVGFADGYKLFDVNATVGKNFDWGSAYVSYNYAWHDRIYNFQRDFVYGLDWVKTQALGRPIGSSLNCSPGNVSVAGTVYSLPNLTTNAENIGNRCNASAPASFYPSEERHSVSGRVTLDNGGPVTASFSTFFMTRMTSTDTGPLLNTAGFSVPSTSASYIPVTPGETRTETINLNFSPVFGDHNITHTKLVTYGFSPEMRIDLGSSWELKALANYGYGRSQASTPLLNPAAITAAVAGTAGAGTINFRNLADPANATALAKARDFLEYGRSVNTLVNTRLVADGSLFHLPGGDVKVAIGAEYISETFRMQRTAGAVSAAVANLPILKASRQVEAIFGEINIPIFGEDTGIFHSLSLSASGRYDHYSDFGGTFNPKFGFNFAPVDWLKLRGTWGKSFQAPGLADLAQAGAPQASTLGASTAIFQDAAHRPTDPLRQVLLVIGGTLLPLDPQKATTYSLGFDVDPPIIPGLSLGVTYYKIKFTDQIAVVQFFLPNFWKDFPALYAEEYQGQAAIAAFRDRFVPQVSNPQVLTSTPLSSIYAIIDIRTQNLGITKTDGLDFHLDYRKDTSFGALYLNVAGNYGLKYITQAAKGATVVNNKLEKVAPRMRVSSTLGAEVGNLQAQVTWNHTDGFSIPPVASALNQDFVKAADLFNLFFQYKVPSDSGIFKDLRFTLNVDNVFDTDPPIDRHTGAGFELTHGLTLGRLFKLGVDKKF